MKPIRKAVIPAAGYGTRFLPATKSIPKEMIPIVDKPVIQYVVEEAIQSGIEEILIITGHGKRAIEDHFDTNVELEYHLRQQGKLQYLELVQEISKINVHYIRQKHMRGLGDAILCAESFIDNEPFAVLLGDDIIYHEQEPAMHQLMRMYNKYGATMVGCQTLNGNQDVPRNILQSVATEKTGISRFLNVEKVVGYEADGKSAMLGRYVLTPDIFEILRRVQPDENGEIRLADALKIMASRQAVYACQIEGKHHDVGNHLDYIKATVEYALRCPEIKDAFRTYLNQYI